MTSQTIDTSGNVTSSGQTSQQRSAARGGDSSAPLLQVNDLVKHFDIRGGFFGVSKLGAVRAVDGVSFTVNEGETLGLVGESGCGKTTLGKVILRLLPPTAGTVNFEGRQLFDLTPRELKAARRDIQVVSQDPYASLNPRMSVGEIVGEGLFVHGMTNRRERESAVRDLLKRVGLNQQHIHRYPHEFSGGQRQRIGIARALASEPDLLVLDEATSALDVSVQAQVLDILAQLRRDTGLTYLFISHNLGVVRAISEDVLVLRAGKVVERGGTEQVLAAPSDPYTRRLRRSALEPSRMVGRKPRDVVRGIAAARIAESAASA
jgi:peptide/nickel transport system ATP-binding protein